LRGKVEEEFEKVEEVLDEINIYFVLNFKNPSILQTL